MPCCPVALTCSPGGMASIFKRISGMIESLREKVASSKASDTSAGFPWLSLSFSMSHAAIAPK